MSSSIYLRLLGQAVTLGLHGGNSVVMFLSMHNQDLLKDVAIKNMTSLQSRYLTVWNIAFQMSYFSLAFACDFLTVAGKDNLIPKSIRRFRQTFFNSLIFPVAVLIFTIFWPIFIYDRELLFPAFIDKIFSFKSNLIMHFCILPAAVWELAFLPRLVPKSHRLNLGILVVLYVVYNSLVLHTYSQSGLFPYPIFTMTYGTIYFPMFLIAVLFLENKVSTVTNKCLSHLFVTVETLFFNMGARQEPKCGKSEVFVRSLWGFYKSVIKT